MRISLATLVIVLSCLLGAIATSAMITWQYQVVEGAQERTQTTQLAGRDLRQLKVMLGQWFVSIDLFFVDQQSYVASGIIKQGNDLKSLWLSIDGIAAEQQKQGAAYVDSIIESVGELAVAGPESETAWATGIKKVDTSGLNFVNLFEGELESNMIQILETERKYKAARDTLTADAKIAALTYLCGIIFAWSWANKTLVQPIRKLESSAAEMGNAPKEYSGEQFRLKSAPREIQQLSDAMAAYVNQIASNNKIINEQKFALQTQLNELHETRNELIKAEKMASVAKLAAGIAHEINNPMSFVSSNLKTLNEYQQSQAECLKSQHKYLKTIEQQDPENSELKSTLELWDKFDIEFLLEDVGDMLADITDGTERITRIVRELSAFTKVSHQTSIVDLGDLVEQLVEDFPNDQKSVSLSLDLATCTQVSCAPEQLSQAIKLVIDNAVEATDGAESRVEISTGATDQNVWIEVSDNGPGIAEDELLKIYDPFYTTKPVGSGLGLSLHFVQSIIDQHDGSISCESARGQGTKMRMSIPRRIAEAA